LMFLVPGFADPGRLEWPRKCGAVVREAPENAKRESH
jgi:hypothetical protein